jgi:hypothetical protein
MSDIPERFWAKVDKTGDCWIWQGSCRQDGYGQFAVRKPRRTVKAHRFAWELAHGPISEGLAVCHSCDNPPCVNVAHLFLGTTGDNVRDSHAKGRAAVGDRMPTAKLTPLLVRTIRAQRLSGMTHQAIADCAGVSRQLITHVLSGHRWRHV